jgi:endo-1,4-beta-xylanase
MRQARRWWIVGVMVALGCGAGDIGGAPTSGSASGAGAGSGTGGEGAASTGGGPSGGGPSGGASVGGAGVGGGDPDTLRARVSPELQYIGAAIDMAALDSDPDYRALAAKELNQLTPENAMKWGPLQPSAGTWFFDDADALVDFAEDNGQAVHGHALVWHQQLPPWVTSTLTSAELAAAVDAHIDATVGRYQGRIRSWDVVNEAIDDRGALRNSILSDKLGAQYIAKAFQRAKTADPAALLWYNDYGIEGPGAKLEGVAALMQQLLDDGVPIDGVGLQFHVTGYDFASFELRESEMRSVIQRFAAMGLRVRISELDVRVANLPEAATRLDYQRRVYHALGNICRTEPGCEELATWGFTDKYSWVDSFFGADDPLLLDDALQRKPAYSGLAAALEGDVDDGFDLGLATQCGSTLAEFPWCAPFEALDSGRDYTAATNGTLAIAAGGAYRGDRYAVATTDAGAPSGTQALVGRTSLPALTSGTVYLRAYVRVPSSAPANTITLMAVGEADPPYHGVSLNLDGGLFQMAFTTAWQFPKSNVPMALDSWHCLQLAVTIGDTAGSAEAKVDGVPVVSASGLDTLPVGGISNGDVGILYVAPGSGAGEAHFDEVAVGTAPVPCD